MKGSGRPGPISTTAILSLLITLAFLFALTNAVFGASPVINYTSQQMSINGTQTLTVSGGCGEPYTWGIVSGGGGLSSTTGAATTYTAPSSNANCTNNPLIRVMDACGNFSDLNGAVNNPGETGIAFYRAIFTSETGNCSRVISLYSFACNGANQGRVRDCDSCSCNVPTPPYQECSCSLVRIGQPPNGFYCFGEDQIARCNANSRCGSANGLTINCEGDTDARTTAQKTAGCCPVQALGQVSTTSQTNEMGNSSTTDVCTGSSTNVKSGNLYNSQDVGILTLSYNSIDTNDGVLGLNWTHNHNLRLVPSTDGTSVAFRAEDGNQITFRLSNGIYYPEAISGDTSQIVKNSDNTYTRTLENGLVSPSGMVETPRL